jgi:hypothetical protein
LTLEITDGKNHQDEKLSSVDLMCQHLFFSARDDRDMMMLEEQSTNGNNYVSPFPHHSMFFTHQSPAMNSGGPDRLKFQSYRSSPYQYSQQRKSSPIDGKSFVCVCFYLFTHFQTVKHYTIVIKETNTIPLMCYSG